MALSQVVSEVMLYLTDELLGIFRIKAQHLAESLEADVLQVTVGQSLDIGIGLDHLFFCERV